MFKALIAMLLGSESAYQTRKTYRQKRVEPQHIQDARIAAAQAKRARREVKLAEDTYLSVRFNPAHTAEWFGRLMSNLDHVPNRLNPLYINRSTTV